VSNAEGRAIFRSFGLRGRATGKKGPYVHSAIAGCRSHEFENSYRATNASACNGVSISYAREEVDF
jgi:hypothetical protein